MVSHTMFSMVGAGGATASTGRAARILIPTQHSWRLPHCSPTPAYSGADGSGPGRGHVELSGERHKAKQERWSIDLATLYQIPK
jgi:hypothetical protein